MDGYTPIHDYPEIWLEESAPYCWWVETRLPNGEKYQRVSWTKAGAIRKVIKAAKKAERHKLASGKNH